MEIRPFIIFINLGGVLKIFPDPPGSSDVSFLSPSQTQRREGWKISMVLLDLPQ